LHIFLSGFKVSGLHGFKVGKDVFLEEMFLRGAKMAQA